MIIFTSLPPFVCSTTEGNKYTKYSKTNEYRHTHMLWSPLWRQSAPGLVSDAIERDAWQAYPISHAHLLQLTQPSTPGIHTYPWEIELRWDKPWCPDQSTFGLCSSWALVAWWSMHWMWCTRLESSDRSQCLAECWRRKVIARRTSRKWSSHFPKSTTTHRPRPHCESRICETMCWSRVRQSWMHWKNCRWSGQWRSSLRPNSSGNHQTSDQTMACCPMRKSTNRNRPETERKKERKINENWVRLYIVYWRFTIQTGIKRHVARNSNAFFYVVNKPKLPTPSKNQAKYKYEIEILS